ncbi:MAG: helix-turn-helix transcriptional regulator [Chitinophagaceae bacterium]
MSTLNISSLSHYHTVVAKVETFLERGFSNLSAEETQDLKTMTEAVARYETNLFPMPLKTTLPELIKYYMFANRLSQADLSKKLQVPPSTVSGLITGKKRLNIDIAKKLHRELQIDADTLLDFA